MWRFIWYHKHWKASSSLSEPLSSFMLITVPFLCSSGCLCTVFWKVVVAFPGSSISSINPFVSTWNFSCTWSLFVYLMQSHVPWSVSSSVAYSLQISHGFITGRQGGTRRHALLSVRGPKDRCAVTTPGRLWRNDGIGGWSDAHCFVSVGQKPTVESVLWAISHGQCSVVPEGWTVSVGHQLTGVSLSPLLAFPPQLALTATQLWQLLL